MMTREEVYNEGFADAKSEVFAYLGSLLDDFEDKWIEVYTEYGYAPLPITIERVVERLKWLEKSFIKRSMKSMEAVPRSEFDYEWTRNSGYDGGMLMASLDLGCLLDSIETRNLTLDQVEEKIRNLKESYDDEV